MKTRCKFMSYEDLWPHELFAIVAYMDYNDTTQLAAIIKRDSNSPLGLKSQGMRNFIADVVTGKQKRQAGKKVSTRTRDFEIYLYISDLRNEDIPLTSNIKGDGNTAVSIAAEKFFPGLDKAATVLKSYQRIQKELGEAETK